jgi:hydroxymethylbilane synthase
MATRGSPLARRQTGDVAMLLTQLLPGLRVEEVVVSTSGDRATDVPLDQIGGQGVFVKEVQAAVLAAQADVTIHSAKDLPADTPEGLTIAAVPPRGDVRDAVVGDRLADLAPGATVATGSARRRAQLANLRPDLTFVDLRGNMARRVARAADPDVGAVVVAKVALDRLGWTARISEVIGTDVLLPQVGQGAIAVECRADDDDVLALLAGIDDRWSHRAVDAERACLRALGASCSGPVGAWAESVAGDAGLLHLQAMTASPDGRILVRSSLRGRDPDALGVALAAHLMDECGGRSVDEVVRSGADAVADAVAVRTP